MAIDWDMVQFKRKIIDNARYLFSNYIDTTKGLEPFYNRPEVSTDKAKCYKNFDAVRLTSDSSGDHRIAWKIDDASNINKIYVRAKVSVLAEGDGSLIISDSTLENLIMFWIGPGGSNQNFRIVLRKNGSDSVPYRESVDLSRGVFYDIEGMFDLKNNTISAARDNVGKTALSTDRLPSFDEIYVGFRAYDGDSIPITLGKDVFITWE